MSTRIVPIPPENTKHFKIARTLEDLQDGTKSVFSIVPKVPVKGILELYENSIKFYHPDQQTPNTEPPERQENDIKEFSKKSRKRLFDIFNKINYSSYGVPIFLSLTFHYDNPNSQITLKNFLRNFLKRLMRFLPPFDYIWKFEYQERGTPHFHLIIFPLDKSKKIFTPEIEKQIKSHWLELKTCKCSHCKKYAAHVIEVKNYKMALSYIAKEIAKVQERYEDHDLGRVWGTSRNLRTNKIDEIKISLNDYEKYLNKAIFLIDEKIKLLKPDQHQTLKNLESSKLYIQGLKFVPYNSTVYINKTEIDGIFREDKLREKNKTKSKSFILKKYSWR